jgi:DNA (cytosine-5)-methyltransferase 1
MRYTHNKDLFNNQITRFRMAGYRVAHKLLEAKDYGLPQDRKRVLIVGIRSDLGATFEFPIPTHGPNSKGKKPYKTLRDTIWKYKDNVPEGSFCAEPLHWYYLSRNRRRDWDQQSPCIVAHWRHTGLHPDSPSLEKVGPDQWQFCEPGNARRFSYLECAAIQGFPNPKKFNFGHVRERFRAIGNAVPPPLFAAVARQLKKKLRT